MKKIINDVQLVEEEMLEGIRKAYPAYVRRVDGTSVLVRAEKKEGNRVRKEKKPDACRRG